MTVFADIPPGLMRKFVVRTTLWIIFLGIVLFGTAGTMHWPQGWIYLGFLSVVSSVSVHADCVGLWLSMLTFKANSYATGQDPEGARAQGGDHRALRLCAPPDVFRDPALLGGHRASVRIVVGT